VTRPRIDVIIPCYNYGRYLPACVESVLAETRLPLRVLIIDDASTDGSADVARLLALSDERIHVILHNTNRGHIATYNQGLAWAEADYLLLLSADDLVAPGALSRAVSLMDARPEVAFVYGRAQRFVEDAPKSQVLAPDRANRAGVSSVHRGADFIRSVCDTAINPVETATAVVRTSVQRAVGGYRPEFPHAGDLDMWLRCAAHGDVGFIRADQAYVRLHGGNMRERYAGEDDIRQRRDVLQAFFANHHDLLPAPRALRRRALGRLAADVVENAGLAFDQGRAYRSRTRLAREIWPPVVLGPAYLRLAAKRAIRSLGLGQHPQAQGLSAGARSRPRPGRRPQVSLILSTRDRAAFLPPCLDSLEAIRTSSDWELIIVDNGSTDDTWFVLQGFVRRTRLKVKLLREPTPGLAHARNTGVRAATGDVLCFTDDDCYPAPDFIDAVANVFEENDVGFMGGQIRLHDPNDAPVCITTRTEQALFPAGSFITTGEIHGACMAFRREVFDDIGLFDTAFGAGAPLKGAEDCEFVARACFAGWNGGFFPEPVIYHHHRRRGDGAVQITRSYDYSRGAFFAKLLLKHARFRPLVLKTWYWDTPVLWRPSRRVLQKLWREAMGAAHYLVAHALRPSTPVA
jgi:glycosyltransferase involved in cell wall biosynthesis